MRETLLEIERGCDAFERESQLHHRKRHVRLDADDDRLRAAQTVSCGDDRASVRAANESITSSGGDVDDHAARPEPPTCSTERLGAAATDPRP